MSDSAMPHGSRTKRPFRRLLSLLVGLVAFVGVLGANVPTAGAAIRNWYHNYQITRPAYEAKYGLWTQLDIPSQFRVNGIHSTLLYNGDVLIMAGSGNDQSFFDAGTFKTLLLNPVTMQMRLIPTPWDLFCAGHIELPNGNILVAGGTARYEILRPVYAGGSMTIMNYDTTQPFTLPKRTIFTAPDGAKFASAFALTVPRAIAQRPRPSAGIRPSLQVSRTSGWMPSIRARDRLSRRASAIRSRA
jgi:hypothetical protein